MCTAHHIDSHLAGDILIFATDATTTLQNPTATFLFLPDNTTVQQLTVLNQNLSTLLDVQITPNDQDILV